VERLAEARGFPSGVALKPSTTVAGSPGTRRMSAKISTLMPRSNGTARARRRAAYTSMGVGQASQVSSNRSSSDDSGREAWTLGFVQ
jgi:hypothetical protein